MTLELLEPVLEVEVAGEIPSRGVELLQRTMVCLSELSAAHLVSHRWIPVLILVVSLRYKHAPDEAIKGVVATEAIAHRKHLEAALFVGIQSHILPYDIGVGDCPVVCIHEEMSERGVLAEGLPELGRETLHEGGVIQNECLQRPTNFKQLVKRLHCFRGPLGYIRLGDIDVGDLRGEGQVVQDVVDPVVHRGVSRQIQTLQLLRPHQPISHLLHLVHSQHALLQHQFSYPLVLAQHLRNGSRHPLRYVKTSQGKSLQVLPYNPQRVPELLFNG